VARNWIYITFGIIVLSIALFVGVWWVPGKPVGYGKHIYPYNAQRDRQAILHQFEQDWGWLVADTPDNYSAAYRIDYAAPSKAPGDINRMQIDVYHKDGQTVGFVAYYMDTPFKGTILFLSVDRGYRKQGIAQALLAHAVGQLKRRGARVVELITLVNNYAAQRVYERFGFQRTWIDEPFIAYRYYFDREQSHSYSASDQVRSVQPA